MNPYSMVADILSKAKKALVTTHVNPDGDAVGSLLGLGLALKSRGLDVTVYLEHSIPQFLEFLPGAHLVMHELNGLADFDVAVVLDCSGLERTGRESAGIGRVPVVVNIDHHESNNNYGHQNLVFPDSTATSEIVYYLLLEMGHTIGLEEAMNLYTGIVSDTGSFCYGNVSRNTFSVAADLIGAGIDPKQIASALYGRYKLNRLKLLKRALETVEMYLDDQVGVITLLSEDMAATNASPEDIRGFVDFVSYIPGVEVGVLIRELNENEVEVSLRSNGRCNLAKLASKLGGGGHKSAAGFTYKGDVQSLKNNLVEYLKPIF